MVNQWMSGDRLRTDTSRLYRSLVVVKPKLGRFSKALHACNDAANPSWTLRGLEIRSIVFVIEFAYVCLIYSCNNRKGKGCEWNWWKRVWLENEWKWLPTKWGCHFHRSNFGQLHRRFDSKMMVSFDILVGKVNSSPEITTGNVRLWDVCSTSLLPDLSVENASCWTHLIRIRAGQLQEFF